MITIECRAKIYTIQCYAKEGGAYCTLGYLPSDRLGGQSDRAKKMLEERPALAKVCCNEAGMFDNPIQMAVVVEFLLALVEAGIFFDLSSPGIKILGGAGYDVATDELRNTDLGIWSYSVVRKVGEES